MDRSYAYISYMVAMFSNLCWCCHGYDFMDRIWIRMQQAGGWPARIYQLSLEAELSFVPPAELDHRITAWAKSGTVGFMSSEFPKQKLLVKKRTYSSCWKSSRQKRTYRPSCCNSNRQKQLLDEGVSNLIQPYAAKRAIQQIAMRRLITSSMVTQTTLETQAEKSVCT